MDLVSWIPDPQNWNFNRLSLSLVVCEQHISNIMHDIESSDIHRIETFQSSGGPSVMYRSQFNFIIPERHNRPRIFVQCDIDILEVRYWGTVGRETEEERQIGVRG